MELFDRSQLMLKPLASRKHDLTISTIRPLTESSVCHNYFRKLASLILKAKKNKSAIVLIMGAHVIRAGVQNYIIDLMERGYLSCIAMNGAGVIHDYEFALIGATTESVSRYIKEGQFGLWEETGHINDIIKTGYKNGLGFGQAIGSHIFKENFPHKKISLLAAGYKLNIPITIHVGIGLDIIHQHPNCDGESIGGSSYRDFLAFAAILQNLEGGIVMNFGSAVTGPEVFLKALSMARNVAHQKNEQIRNFATLVCDLVPLFGDWRREPPKNDPAYFFRPLKTMLVRTVADGGQSFYVRGSHEDTFPSLWTAINEEEKKIAT